MSYRGVEHLLKLDSFQISSPRFASKEKVSVATAFEHATLLSASATWSCNQALGQFQLKSLPARKFTRKTGAISGFLGRLGTHCK